MKKCMTWLMAALCSVAVAAPAMAADTIKIGVQGAHSGDLASYGVPSLNAAKIVIEEANAKGGAEAVREAGLKFAVQQIRTLLDNGAPGIHLYTLNKAAMCQRIAEEVGAL